MAVAILPAVDCGEGLAVYFKGVIPARKAPHSRMGLTR